MLVFYYLLAVNLVAFIIMGYDKTKAMHKERRVPEKRLFLIATIGGALGMLLGMRFFRHKTKHRSFTAGIPALLVLNAVLVMVWFGR